MVEPLRHDVREPERRVLAQDVDHRALVETLAEYVGNAALAVLEPHRIEALALAHANHAGAEARRVTECERLRRGRSRAAEPHRGLTRKRDLSDRRNLDAGQRGSDAGAVELELDAIEIPGDVRLDHRRSEEHTSELQSRLHLVCRLLLEKKKINDVCSLYKCRSSEIAISGGHHTI